MALTGNDPLALAAERIRLNAAVSTLASQISAWTGDANGALDLRIKMAEANYRLNKFTTASTALLGNMAGTAFATFGLETLST